MREFAEAADADPFSHGGVPQIAVHRRGEVAVRVSQRSAAFRQVRRAAARVIRRPEFFDHIGRVGGHRELVAVVADLRVHIEVIEDAELARERVRVRRHLIAEQTQRWIVVAPLEIAEYLIVGPVLADDVENVLDRRRVADPPRDRRPDRGVRRREAILVGVARDRVDHLRQRLEPGAVRRR